MATNEMDGARKIQPEMPPTRSSKKYIRKSH